jgi:hypothetical protein
MSQWCAGSVFVEEPFDVLPTEGSVWQRVYVVDDATAEIRGDDLWVTVDAPTEDDGAYWGLLSHPVPASGVLGVEALAWPGPTDMAELYLGLQLTTGNALYIAISRGDLRIIYYDGAEETGILEISDTFDPVQHRWFQMVYIEDSPLAYFETSPEGSTWTPFAEYDLTTRGLDLDGAVLEFGMGAWQGPVSGDLGAVDNLYVCATNP